MPQTQTASEDEATSRYEECGNQTGSESRALQTTLQIEGTRVVGKSDGRNSGLDGSTLRVLRGSAYGAEGGGDGLSGASSDAFPHSDILRDNDLPEHCKGQLTMVVASVAGEQTVIANFPAAMVCGTAIKGNCSHPCPFGSWSASYVAALSLLLPQDGYELVMAVLPHHQRIVVPSPRDREGL